MTETFINLDTLESDLDKALNEIYSLLEQYKISNLLIKKEIIIENELDEISEKLKRIDKNFKNSNHAKILSTKALQLLQIWFKLINDYSTSPELEHALINNLKNLNSLVSIYRPTGSSEVLDAIDDFQTSTEELKKIAHSSIVPSVLIFKSFITDSITSNISIEIKDKFKNTLGISYLSFVNDMTQLRIEEDSWELNISVSDKDLAKCFHLLSLIPLVFSLEGRNLVELVEVKKGSLIGNFKIWFKNLWDKQSTQELVETVKDEMVAMASKQQMENKKKGTEIKKTELESKKLETELNKYSPEELDKIKNIEMLKMQEELRSLQLDNELKRIQVIEKYGEILAKGILSVEKVELKIGDAVLIKKDQNRLDIGDNQIDLNK